MPMPRALRSSPRPSFFVHALRLELVEVIEITRHVLGRAGRGEGAGKAEDRDLLALHLVLDLEGVGSNGAAVAFDFDEFLHGAFGKLVSDFDRHCFLLVGNQRPRSMARFAIRSMRDGARSLSQRPILPRAVITTSRSRR